MKRLLILFVGLILVTAVAVNASVPPLQEEIFHARDKVMPALVHIQPIITDFRTGKMIKQSVVGSGVIFDPEGYVVTNFHVAGKAERIICTLYDKEQVNAELVGGDPLTDIAIIKLDLSEYNGTLNVADFGNSESIQVGQYVLAMGSPLALSRSVSCGVVSTIDRYFSGEYRLPSGEKTGIYNNWIQTDAAINPGNSGGPLVDLTGKVIGINSRAILFANNIGFAVPINIVRQVSEEIISSGKVVRSWIGVKAQALQDLEGWFGTERDKGVLIASIDAKSPASDAGLKAGDIILSIDDNPVSVRFEEQIPHFYKMIADHPIGSEVQLRVRRGEEIKNIAVTTSELGEVLGEDLECREWGFTVKAITKQMAVDNQLDDTLGVFVAGVKRVGAGAEGGLRRGDVIRKVNEEPANNLEEFYDMYTQLTDEKVEKIMLNVKRVNNIKYVLLQVDYDSPAEGER